MNHASRILPEKIFDFDDDIRSAMVVDRLGNVIAFASRTGKPVDPSFVNEIASKWTALLGGMLRGNEAIFGVLKWVHLRYRKVHIYCWLVEGGYLVFTSKSQLEDALLDQIGTSQEGRARYAELWGVNETMSYRPLASPSEGPRAKKNAKVQRSQAMPGYG
jgi:hypothetical protein